MTADKPHPRDGSAQSIGIEPSDTFAPPNMHADNNAVDEANASCTVPPPGWWCSRAKGHEGPCAAREAAVLHVHHHDVENHAKSYNEGYQDAVTQGLADDPSLAADWLAEHDAAVLAAVDTKEAAAKALEEAADALDAMAVPPPSGLNAVAGSGWSLGVAATAYQVRVRAAAVRQEGQP